MSQHGDGDVQRRARPSSEATWHGSHVGPSSEAGDFAIRLPCSADSASEARRQVVTACLSWGCGLLCDAAELVTAELVSNALRHARTRIELAVRRTPRGVLVEVSDDSPRLPERREPGLFDESGRGLWLVDAMAERWGVERELPGKRVWAELAQASHRGTAGPTGLTRSA